MIGGVNIRIQVPPVIGWTALVFLTLFVAVLTHSGILWTADLRFLWLTIYGFSFVMIVDRVGKGRFFEPFVVMQSAYLLIIAIGSTIFELLKEKEYQLHLFNFVGIGYFGMLAGVLLAQDYLYTFNLDRVKQYTFVSQLMKNRTLNYLSVMVCILATLALFAKEGVPMFAADVQQARLDLLSNGGYLNLFMFGLAVFPLAFLYDAITRDSRTALIWSHVLAGFVLLAILLCGGRSKTFAFLAEYVGMYYFFKRRRFSLKLMFAGISMLLIFLAVVGVYRRGGTMDVPTLTKEVGITMATRPVMFGMVVDKFSLTKMFYGTRYFADLVKILPGHQTGANVDLKYEIWPNADKMPDSSGVTPSVIGEAYMNFGVPGIFWFMFFEGFFLGLTYRLMIRKPTFLRTAFYFILVINSATAISAGMGTRLIQLLVLWFWLAIVAFLYEWRLKVCGNTLSYSCSVAR
jgi:oligosaccharide repeat unit polymerase